MVNTLQTPAEYLGVTRYFDCPWHRQFDFHVPFKVNGHEHNGIVGPGVLLEVAGTDTGVVGGKMSGVRVDYLKTLTSAFYDVPVAAQEFKVDGTFCWPQGLRTCDVSP